MTTEYIDRLLTPSVLEAHKYFPVIVITGPRQSGKSTLCRHLFPDYTYTNLEDITLRTNAMMDPTGFLDSLGKNAIIDEVQNVPELLSMIQVRVDEFEDRKYILSGSSNFSLLRTISQSLAGRAAIFTLLPSWVKETKAVVDNRGTENIILDGLYPRVIAKGVPSSLYYRNYYNTYVERDLRDLLKLRNLLTFDKFVRLLAARVGSEFNASAFSREVGVSSNTISEWLSLLATSYITYPLQPYFSNLSKRLTKMPKVYFYDTGLLCYILGIENHEQLENHPLKGTLFENLAMGELLKQRYNNAKDPNLYFYREKSGIEVDAILIEAGGLHLYEMKAGKTIRPEFMENMNSLKQTMSNVTASTIIFDGDNLPPMALNIRNI